MFGCGGLDENVSGSGGVVVGSGGVYGLDVELWVGGRL